MNSRERVCAVLNGGQPDRVPRSTGYWGTTAERWWREGLPEGVSPTEFFGTDEIGSIIGDFSMQFPERLVSEEPQKRTYWDVDGALRTDLETPEGTTTQWLDFTIKTRDDWLQHRHRMAFNEDRIPKNAKAQWAQYRAAGKAVYFQLLDDQYRCVQTMRSFTGVMPGEVRGCVGCHEQQDTIPSNTVRSIAQKKGPAMITPAPWGEESIGYKRFVQPILDKNCAKCHQGDKNAKALKAVDMTFRDGKSVGFRGRAGHRKADASPFAEPYLTFVSGGTHWGRGKDKITLAGGFVVEGYSTIDPESLKTLKPMSIFSYKSKLLQNATSGKHHKMKIDAASQRRLTAWIDSNCPYLGEEEIRAMDDPDFKFMDTLKLRPRVKTAPEINRFNIRQDGDSTAVANDSMKNQK